MCTLEEKTPFIGITGWIYPLSPCPPAPLIAEKLPPSPPLSSPRSSCPVWRWGGGSRDRPPGAGGMRGWEGGRAHTHTHTHTHTGTHTQTHTDTRRWRSRPPGGGDSTVETPPRPRAAPSGPTGPAPALRSGEEEREVRGVPSPCPPLPHHDVTPRLRFGGAGGEGGELVSPGSAARAQSRWQHLGCGTAEGGVGKGFTRGVDLGSRSGARRRLGDTASVLWGQSTGVGRAGWWGWRRPRVRGALAGTGLGLGCSCSLMPSWEPPEGHSRLERSMGGT